MNESIRASRVRLIGEEGQQLGIKQIDDARTYAYGKGLDLVEVAAQADPPVAKVMENGKYRYEQDRKRRGRKNQTQIHVKEIKLRPKIGIHDYETKKGHVVRFLNQRAKVKVTIMFRGRDASTRIAGVTCSCGSQRTSRSSGRSRPSRFSKAAT